jgi:hypothetical protein
MPVVPVIWEAEGGGLRLRPAWAKVSVRLYLKSKLKERTGEVAELVEQLPSCERPQV